MTVVGTVESIWRYPAKSMQGESLPSVEVTNAGIVGDRGWAARDEVNGGIRGAKKIGALMQLAARYERPPTTDDPVPPITVTLPDGSTVSSLDPDFAAQISRVLDHEVTMWPLQPADVLEHYRRGAPSSDDVLEELRSMFGRTEDEPLPDLSVFPPELFEFESLPGSYFDAFPLHVLTTTSLDSLGRLLPEAAVDVRRFRPNIVVRLDDAASDFPDQTWVGGRLQIGALDAAVVAPCPRCVMPTRAFADLPQDRSILRTIVAEADQKLGVYATASGPATIRVGDIVSFDPS